MSSVVAATGSALVINLVNLLAGFGVVLVTGAEFFEARHAALAFGALLLAGIVLARRLVPFIGRLAGKVIGRPLDVPTLDTLFRDLAQCTQIIAVVPKTAAQAMTTPVTIDLADARTGLTAGQFRGVQIRYLYESKEWCDTLLATPAGVRLVRICTDDAHSP